MNSNSKPYREPDDMPEVQAYHRLPPRVASRLVAGIRCGDMPLPLIGQVRDVGPGGVCVETVSQFALVSRSFAKIDFPDFTLTLKVEGRWQRDAPGRSGVLTGMRFVDLPASEIQHLWSYVYQRAGELASFLRERSQLSGIHYHDAVDLAFFTRLVQYSAGDRIYRQGTYGSWGDSAFVLYQGNVSIEARNRSDECVYVDQIDEGGVFGGIPILASSPHLDSAVAQTDVLLLEIDPYSYRYLEASRSQAIGNVRQALIRRYADKFAVLVGQTEQRSERFDSRPMLESMATDEQPREPRDSRGNVDSRS